MTTYYIDPVAGSDSNNGTSWALAFKTFRPIETRVVTPVGGDIIKIAKTDEEELGFTLDNVRLASAPSSTGTNGLHGWTVPNLIVPAGLSTRLLIIDSLQDSSGWTNVNSLRSTISTGASPHSPTVNYFYLYTPKTDFIADTKLCYKALAATVNLSSFGRIEFKCGGSGWEGATQQVLKLCFCSDTLGDTSLLEIPFNPSLAVSGVISYEGTLPSGVNSLSIRQGSVANSRSSFSLQSLIATQVHSSANYFGHFTLLKAGNHEAATFAPVRSFSIISSNQVMQFYQCAVGPASLDNTTFVFRYYKTASWASGGSFDSQVYAGYGLYEVTARDYVDGTKYKKKLLFNLADLSGSNGNPIQIIGGYDTGTDTVTGRTRLMNRQAVEGNYRALPAFAFINCKYITVKNIETFTDVGGTFCFAETSYGIRFEDCRFSSVRAHQAGWHATLQRQQADVTSLLYDLYFKNCAGDFYLTDVRSGDYGSDDLGAYLPLGNVKDVTLENCIICPYSGTGTVDQDAFAPNNIPHDIVGTLKCYCVGGFHYLLSINVAGRMRFPAIKSGAAGTLYVYGGGGMYANPVPAYNQTTGNYTFPNIVAENVSLIFNDLFEYDARFPLSVTGAVESCTLLSFTATFTSAAWHGGVTNTISYYPDALFSVPADFPPLWIQQVALSGTPFAGYAGGTTSLVFLRKAQVQVSAVTATSAWNLMLLRQVAASNGAYGPSVYIVDGFTHASKALTTTLYPLYGNSSGTTDALVSGILDLRNVSYNNTATAAYYYLINSSYWRGARVRFVDSSIVNSGNSYAPVSAFPDMSSAVESSRFYGNYGESGLVIEDSTIALNATSILNLNSTAVDYGGSDTSFTTWPAGITVVDSNAGTHVTYWPSLKLEKDTAIYYAAPFSWKSTTRSRHTLPTSSPYPLGTVPVKLGNTITVSLRVRRSTTTDCHAGLLIYHHGAAGYALATDLAELVQLASGAANAWELVSIQFVVQRSTIIDIYFTHFGTNGTSAWFDDLQVIEQ
jgi:hypothetical protein